MIPLALLVLALDACYLSAAAADPDPALIELNQRSFFLGREYYVLRSGRAKLVVQADRAELGPAFTYLLFDALQARQSQVKSGAFNEALADGRNIAVSPEGAVRLPKNYREGSIVLRARAVTP